MASGIVKAVASKAEVNTLSTKVAAKANTESIAYISEGNAHVAIAEGGYIYVQNHETLSDGLYKAKTAIAENGGLSSANVDSAKVMQRMRVIENTLSNAIIIQEYSCNVSSIAAGGYVAVTASDLNISSKTGYTLTGIVGFESASYNIVPYRFKAVTSGNVLGLRNISSGATGASTSITVKGMWVRNDLV